MEVLPGPRLNIVVGPNGSGKSALVNAMALAMGAHPRVLGRGDRLGSFIMRGKEEGWVEIELITPPHNLVVRREFFAKKPVSPILEGGCYYYAFIVHLTLMGCDPTLIPKDCICLENEW